MSVKFKCDGCDEIYDSFKEAWECHIELDPSEPTYWQQLMLDDEMDCA